MIVTENLTKQYGDTAALTGLNLRVEPGEILGFLGPNGAGKSNITSQPLEAKKRLGYVPETPALFETLTADAFLDVMGALYHLDPATSRTRRGELLNLFDLGPARFQRIREFSKGMKQKVIIVSALLHRPEVLILDEPFDGIDANSALVMKGLLKQMAAQGRTILFSSHILEVVERICTRVCIIDKGRVVAEGTAPEICRSFRVATLDEAFGQLTGIRAAADVTADILAALDRG